MISLSMNIYSNSYFHRTNSSSLKSILEEGFKCFYCKEEVFLGNKDNLGTIGIPMVSFSDIPFSFLSQNNYGKLGLGMSRRWGRTRHLEPVLYYPNDKDCQSTKMVIQAYRNFDKDRDDTDKYRILGYAKPLMKISCNIRDHDKDNYKEREWRKVYACPSPLKWLNLDEYTKYRDRASEKIAVGNILKFKSKDIDFILVDKCHYEEILSFIMNEMKTIGGQESLTQAERIELISKMVEYEKLERNI